MAKKNNTKKNLTAKELHVIDFSDEESALDNMEGVIVNTTFNVSLYKIVDGARVYKNSIIGNGLLTSGTETFDIGFTSRTDQNGLAEILMSEIVGFVRGSAKTYFPPFNVVATPKTQPSIINARAVPIMMEAGGGSNNVKFIVKSFASNGDALGGVLFDVRALMGLTTGPT